MPSANITTSGGLISDDFINRLREEDFKHPAVGSASFGPDSPTARRVDADVALSYELLRARYEPLRNAIPLMDISDQRKRWLLPILRDLGYEPQFQAAATTVGTGAGAPSFNLSHRGWAGTDAPIIHSILLGESGAFDMRPTKPRGTRSPHDTLQSFLNLTNQHLWAILTDGTRFRLLRDYHQTLTKGYVEIDLAGILESGDVGDFRAFYRLLHPSRFRTFCDGKVPLELFKEDSQQIGVEVGKHLRNQVHAAIECLGNGFLKVDPTLCSSMQADPKACAAYYNEILHLIYRLLFLSFVEQRGWIPTGLTTYWQAYSVSGLRDRSIDPYAAQDDHFDLWEGLKSTFRIVREGLMTQEGEIAAYGGRLFNDKQLLTLLKRGCRNADLLAAIRLLSYFELHKVAQRINYARLEIESLGSVYESLLDYAPRVLACEEDVDGKPRHTGEFVLDPNSMARKTSGSHYTPKALVLELIDSALRPVIKDRLERRKSEATMAELETALLGIRVCDPACGSGAFLQAAMDCLGMELARIRIGEESDPTEDQLRQARRDVLQHCIYGVDLNPMAVELCKVTLWIHAAMPRLPLTFLDHRIRCGNSLIGIPMPRMVDQLRSQYSERVERATMMAREVEAKYDITVRGRKGMSSDRKRGKRQEPPGLQDLPMSVTAANADDEVSLDAIRDELRSLRKEAADEYVGWPDAIPDAALEPVTGDHVPTAREILKRHKEERISGAEQPGLSYKVYTETALDAFREFEGLSQDNADEVEHKAHAWQLWHEQSLKSSEHKLADLWTAAFFWRHREGVLLAPTQAVFAALRRGEQINERIAREVSWVTQKYLFFHWHLEFPEVFKGGGFDTIIGNPPWEMVEADEEEEIKFDYARLQRFIGFGQYKVLQGRRDLYKLFLVNAGAGLSPTGRLGFLTPLGSYMEEECQEWRRLFFNKGSVLRLGHFQNQRKRFFPSVHASYRFCSVVWTPSSDHPHTFTTVVCSEDGLSCCSVVTVPRSDFDEKLGCERSSIIYPDGRYAKVHSEILKLLRQRECMRFRVAAEFHASTDKLLILKNPSEGNWVILKNRNIHHYDYNFAPPEAWVSQENVKIRAERKKLPVEFTTCFPRLVFRDIARNDDERTLIACLAPVGYVSSYDTPMFVPDATVEDYLLKVAFATGMLSSFLFDFLIRPVVDKHIKGYTLARIPWLDTQSIDKSRFPLEWFAERVTYLSFRKSEDTSASSVCQSMTIKGYDDKRLLIRCELDAAFFHLCGIVRDDVDFIMETFSIVKRNDENVYKEYRTKRMILEVYDAMYKVMASGNHIQPASVLLPQALGVADSTKTPSSER